MNLAIMFPVALLALIALVIYYSRRRKAGGSGLGDRADPGEPTELRGTEQWKHREPGASGSSRT